MRFGVVVAFTDMLTEVGDNGPAHGTSLGAARAGTGISRAAVARLAMKTRSLLGAAFLIVPLAGSVGPAVPSHWRFPRDVLPSPRGPLA